MSRDAYVQCVHVCCIVRVYYEKNEKCKNLDGQIIALYNVHFT